MSPKMTLTILGHISASGSFEGAGDQGMPGDGTRSVNGGRFSSADKC
jgi:hypothetical protein